MLRTLGMVLLGVFGRWLSVGRPARVTRKTNAEKGIAAIKTHAPNAKVEDHSDVKSS